MFQMYGVVPPMITPFRENGEVDYQGLKVLVEFLRENVDGLFITGSYGGGVLMTEEERKKVAEQTVPPPGETFRSLSMSARQTVSALPGSRSMRPPPEPLR